MKCLICKKDMTPEENCGGDCLDCMADAGDPECIEGALTKWLKLRVQNESLLVWHTMRAKRKTKAFDIKIGKIAKELEKCTTRINELKAMKANEV